MVWWLMNKKFEGCNHGPIWDITLPALSDKLQTGTNNLIKVANLSEDLNPRYPVHRLVLLHHHFQCHHIVTDDDRDKI